MAKRPWSYDSFQHLKRPLWLTAQDRVGKVLESRLLADKEDPKQALVNALADWAGRGWTLESFDSRNPHFYCHRDGQRRFVSITQADPTKRDLTHQL